MADKTIKIAVEKMIKELRLYIYKEEKMLFQYLKNDRVVFQKVQNFLDDVQSVIYVKNKVLFPLAIKQKRFYLTNKI